MKKPIVLLLTASLLAGCPGPPPPSDGSLGPITSVPMPPGCHDVAWGPLYEVYEATLPNGALDSGYADAIHSPQQPLRYGDAGPAAGGTYSSSPAPDGARALSVTAPKDVPAGQTPSAGLFSTGLDFGLRSAFIARATFQKPDGPRIPPDSDGNSNAWAAAVTARDGDEQDLTSRTRISVTFRVRDQGALLNVIDSGAAGPLATKAIDGAVVASIFNNQPFTLELYVNRQSCTGTATLSTVGFKPQKLSFRLHTFLAESGPTITAIGPALANCCAPKKKVSVEVTNFQIWVPLPGPISTEPNVPNPPPINPH